MAASSNPGPGFGLPPADTGNRLLDRLNGVLTVLLHAERRIDPFYRPLFDRLLREPLSHLATAIINHRRSDEGMALAEEREQPDEAVLVDQIIAAFTRQMEALWTAGHFERGGNTKTHGVVRAEFIVSDDLPEQLRHGLFAQPRSYPAWVRFAGPGPYVTPDIDDVGFMSMSIKIMGVAGPKLLDDERHTQDMLCVVDAHLRHARHPRQRPAAAVELQERRHLLLLQLPPLARARLDHAVPVDEDADQSARERVLQLRPLPAGRGPGHEVLVPLAQDRAHARARLPLRPPDNYLRDAMVSTLAAEDVEFDICAAGADRSVPHADRGRGRAVADQAVAARAGSGAADPAAVVRLARPDGLRARRSPTTPGTASPSTARSATRAAPGAACTGSCPGCASRGTTSSTTSPPATRCSATRPVPPARTGSAPHARWAA